MKSVTLTRRLLTETRPAATRLMVFAAIVLTVLGGLVGTAYGEVAKVGQTVISIGTSEGNQGAYVDLPVSIATTNDVVSTLYLEISFDSALLAFVDAQLDDRLVQDKDLSYSVDGNTLLLTVASISDATITDGVVLVVTFQVADAAIDQTVPVEGTFARAARPYDPNDPFDANVPASAVDGAVLIGCTPPALVAPSATSNRSDGVLVFWGGTVAAAEYRVYRGPSSNPAEASALSDWQDALSYLDTTAEPPQTTSGMGCSGPQTVPIRYYYWVLARTASGCTTDFGTAAQGERGAAKKFEAVLPATKSSVAPDAPLALRLRSEDPIDPASVWGVALESGVVVGSAVWQVVDGSNGSDGWVVFRPSGTWTPGTTVAVKAGAQTVSGAVIATQKATFAIAVQAKAGGGALWQPASAVDAHGFGYTNEGAGVASLQYAEGAAVPAFPDGVGEAYAISPDMPFETPQRIWLPVPDGLDPNALTVFYLHSNADGTAVWVAGDQLAGWLAPEGTADLVLDGVTYRGLLVNHGGTLQLGYTPGQGVSAASLGGSTRDGNLLWADMLPFLLAVLVVLFGAKSRAARI